MSKKIILFLSDFDQARSREQIYACPSGPEVLGTQTNEAPVQYLLRAYPDVSDVVCVVTSIARANAWDRFQKTVKEAAPGVQTVEISFEEDQDFGRTVLPEITARVRAGDEILLDTTGGFRNAIMYLLLISRVLSYSGVRTVGAVYSNFRASRVEDVSHLVSMFDLVGGMQELASFGSVGALRDYYQSQRQPEPEIAPLLSAMEALNEDITLCRTARLDERIERFNSALDQAETCADPLMRALLPAFRAKFNKKLSIPGLIKWCVSNGMIQQALTIYKERIPDYLFQRGILSVSYNAPEPETVQPYETGEAARFREHLAGQWKLLRDGKQLPDFGVAWDNRYPASRIEDIVRDYLYIRMLRNMINHANDQSIQPDGLMDYLTEFNYKNVNDTKTEDIKRALLRGLDRLQPPQPKKNKRRNQH